MRIPATITQIARQTPTIKSFDLDLGGHELGFKPGQWVDFFVSLEGAEAVGGYSITSSPSVQDSIGLAVKLDEGDHPVTNWLHKEARVGDCVEISLGGDFYYTPDMNGPIVLIAGGIGLTPLMSIIRAIDEDDRSTPTTLIYSVSTSSEILFRQELDEIARRNSDMKLVFTITRPEEGQEWNGHTGRIEDDLLGSERVNPDSLFFVCGPPDMIRDVIGMLVRMGAPGSRIKYEQWW